MLWTCVVRALSGLGDESGAIAYWRCLGVGLVNGAIRKGEYCGNFGV